MHDIPKKITDELVEPLFDLERYLAEESAEARLHMAEVYIAHADAAWILAYTISASDINQRGAQVDATVERLVKEKLKVSPIVEQLEQFQSNKILFGLLKERGLITQAQLDEALQVGLQEIEKIFHSGEQLSGPSHEAVEWLQQKMLSGDVIIVNSLSESHTPESRASSQEMAKTISAPFALGSMSKIDPTQADTLVVIGDLIDPKVSTYEVLMSIAHERGHETINKIGISGVSKDTALVLNEFYPMLEAQRLYLSLNIDERARVAKTVRSDYEIDPEMKEMLLRWKLPGASDAFQFKYNEATLTLIKAYQHSLESIQRHQKYMLTKKLIDEGAEVGEVLKQLSKIKIITTPVVTVADIERQRV